MSHYSVMVCLPGDTDDIEKALEVVLAPFDENLDMEPYRRYEDGSADEYWWVRSVRRGAEHLAAGTGILPYKPDGFGGSNYESKKTPDEQRAEFADDQTWAERLGSPTTWGKVARLYNEKFYPNNQVAVPGVPDDDTNDGRLHYEPESDRAYTMSTYNPESKWDYWRIGGRWSGHFQAIQDLPPRAEVLVSESHWDGPKEFKRHSCDGGRKSLLDFEAMRDHDGAEAAGRFDRWLAMVEQYGPIQPWAFFSDQVDLTLTIREARRLYGEQPLVAAHDKLPDGERLIGHFGEPLDVEFGTTREEYVRLAREAAVPAYGLVSLAGEWIAPGRMGWFGMSSDGPGEREGYHLAVNRYLEELKPDTFLVVIDCHI
jgi:hypothetical protein